MGYAPVFFIVVLNYYGSTELEVIAYASNSRGHIVKHKTVQILTTIGFVFGAMLGVAHAGKATGHGHIQYATTMGNPRG